MSEIVVMARARVKEGEEAAAEAAFRDVIAPSHDEAGCSRYALHRAADDPRTFVMLERWSSRGHLDAHLASAHVATLFGKLGALLEVPAEILVLEPLTDVAGEKGRL
jgi:quinol monooxygenase YgiN